MYNVFKVECYVALLFLSFFYIYKHTKNIIEQLQSAWKSFFSVITVNALNKDEDLIQIKWLEKVQHIESACAVTLPDGPLYIS